jgi:hypothetical protein
MSDNPQAAQFEHGANQRSLEAGAVGVISRTLTGEPVIAYQADEKDPDDALF